MATQAPTTFGGRRVLVESTSSEFIFLGKAAALLVIGCLSLAAGVLLYLTDRSASHALLVPAVSPLSGRHLFGAIGLWLPSFVHPLAFSLFSAALFAPRARWQYGACTFWFMVNAAFEIGQHPQVRGPLVDALRHGLGQGQYTLALGNYFLRGTFDVGDLIAAALGAAVRGQYPALPSQPRGELLCPMTAASFFHGCVGSRWSVSPPSDW